MKKSLVIGATGGIGRSTVKALSEDGVFVNVLARSKSKAEKYFKEINNVEIIEGDASSAEDLSKAINGCETLYYCLNVPYDKWEKQVLKLLNVSLNAAADNKVKFVFSGNVYNYGHAQYNPVNEKHSHNAHTKKGKIRIQMEKLIKQFSSEKGLIYTIVRMPDFYGPFVINGFSEKVFQNALLGKSLFWIGDKNVAIEYIFIEDAGKAMAAAGESPKGNNKEFNVPAVEPTTNRFFLDEISKQGAKNSKITIMNSNIVFRLMGLFSPVVKELFEMLYLKREELILDGSLFKETFGFLPATTYEEGIKKTLSWTKNFYNL
ncbi:MAG: SDR family NAD(P)-dependent oxidoreductase [Bacteroidetes bacterium]|nr:SDR family NAD(P)-dependent oxidoreductase [Bacteroidota bacterium]